MHAALLSRFMNPARVWCFNSEAYMGKCRILGEACNKASGNGLGVATCNYIIRRYLHAMHLTMTHTDIWLWRDM
jgi:hypothetical protein